MQAGSLKKLSEIYRKQGVINKSVGGVFPRVYIFKKRGPHGYRYF